MKKLKFVLAAMLVAVVSMFAVSCSKSDDSNSALDKSDYRIAVSYQGGGVDAATLRALEDDFNKDENLAIKNVSYLEASVTFDQYVALMKQRLPSAISSKISADLYVTFMLKDKDGKQKKSDNLTIQSTKAE